MDPSLHRQQLTTSSIFAYFTVRLIMVTYNAAESEVVIANDEEMDLGLARSRTYAAPRGYMRLETGTGRATRDFSGRPIERPAIDGRL